MPRESSRRSARLKSEPSEAGGSGMKRTAAISLALALALGAGIGWAQNFGAPGAQQFFRVEVGAGQTRNGRTVIQGYIYNDYGQAAGRVQLLVESLDSGGQVIAKSIVPVDGILPQFSRTYVEAPVTAGGASYRASVYYYEWIKGGGGM